MTNQARKENFKTPTLALVDTMDIRDQSTDRSWFRSLMCALFSSPDLDLSQFERLEMKRTPEQMRREARIYWGQ